VDNTITAAIFSVLALGGIVVERADSGAPLPIAPEQGEFASPAWRLDQPLLMQNLRLNAFGTGREKPGQIRVPIPADNGVTYEVIVVKPGAGQAVRVAKDEAE
jgi:hypothetical protein